MANIIRVPFSAEPDSVGTIHVIPKERLHEKYELSASPSEVTTKILPERFLLLLLDRLLRVICIPMFIVISIFILSSYSPSYSSCCSSSSSSSFFRRSPKSDAPRRVEINYEVDKFKLVVDGGDMSLMSFSYL